MYSLVIGEGESQPVVGRDKDACAEVEGAHDDIVAQAEEIPTLIHYRRLKKEGGINLAFCLFPEVQMRLIGRGLAVNNSRSTYVAAGIAVVSEAVGNGNAGCSSAIRCQPSVRHEIITYGVLEVFGEQNLCTRKSGNKQE